jgi:hypothetical protein
MKTIVQESLNALQTLVHCNGISREYEALEIIRAELEDVQKPSHNKQSTPCCENCGKKLVTTCVNKKCDWSPVV